MVKQGKFKGKDVWFCDICGFGYADQKTAQSCEDYCREHKGCSMEITKKAVTKG